MSAKDLHPVVSVPNLTNVQGQNERATGIDFSGGGWAQPHRWAEELREDLEFLCIWLRSLLDISGWRSNRDEGPWWTRSQLEG